MLYHPQLLTGKHFLVDEFFDLVMICGLETVAITGIHRH